MSIPHLMAWVPVLHKQVVSVCLRTVHFDTHLVFWMFVSLFATFMSIPLKSYEELKSGKHFKFEDPTFFLLNSGVMFHLFSIRMQTKNVTVLTEFLLEPFRNFPLDSPQHHVICNYYRKFAISWLLMGANLFLCILGQCLSPLFTVLCLSEDVNLEDWPLPLGRVILLWESEWIYWSWYFVSVFSLLTCLVIHSCWFGTFMCSTMLIATKLELLALELDSLDERVHRACNEDLKHFRSLARYRSIRDKVYLMVIKTYIKEIVDENVRIIQQVRLLDRTYRWIILAYIEICILASALIVTISISDIKLFVNVVSTYLHYDVVSSNLEDNNSKIAVEWNSNTNQGFLRFDLLFACIFFAFINNLCGQTVIDKFMEAIYSYINFLITVKN